MDQYYNAPYIDPLYATAPVATPPVMEAYMPSYSTFPAPMPASSSAPMSGFPPPPPFMDMMHYPVGFEPTNRQLMDAILDLKSRLAGDENKAEQNKWLQLARDCFIEFLATGMFILAALSVPILGAAGTAAGIRTIGVSFGFGFTITILVAVASRFSGAHLNPAVTWGLFLAQRIGALRLLYIPCQMVGAITGAAILYGIVHDLDTTTYPEVHFLAVNRVMPGFSRGEALGYEIIFTCLLLTVVLAVTHGKAQFGRASMAPFHIGYAVFIAHMVMVPVDNCSINPARSFGPAVIANYWSDQWIFWVGPLTGATVAGLFNGVLWKLFHGKPVKPAKLLE